MGSFSQDPIGFAAGDANLYRYVGNGPADSTDPSGLFAEGHHWVPLSVAFNLYEEGVITLGDLKIFAGRTSGPLDGGHSWGDVHNGVRHCEYNKEVETQIRAWANSKAKDKVSADKLVDRLRDGRNYNGGTNTTTKKF